MLILIQRIERRHLLFGQLKVKDVRVGNDALGRVGLGERDEPATSVLSFT